LGKKGRYFDKYIYSRSGREQSGCDVVNETQIIMRKTGGIPSFFIKYRELIKRGLSKDSNNNKCH
jgi:hypothetical protein